MNFESRKQNILFHIFYVESKKLKIIFISIMWWRQINMIFYERYFLLQMWRINYYCIRKTHSDIYLFPNRHLVPKISESFIFYVPSSAYFPNKSKMKNLKVSECEEKTWGMICIHREFE
jgi:hypothetical protein